MVCLKITVNSLILTPVNFVSTLTYSSSFVCLVFQMPDSTVSAKLLAAKTHLSENLP